MVIYNNNQGVSGTSISLNGQSVTINTGSNANLKQYRINERKSVQFTDIRTIRIDSSIATITFKRHIDPNVTGYLHGTGNLERPVKLEMEARNRELYIRANYHGVGIGNSINLDVYVPDRVIGAICVNTSSGNVFIKDNINVTQISINTQSGNVVVDSKAASMNVNTMSGGINIGVFTTRPINLNCASMSGGISIVTRNVGTIQLNAKTQSGMIQNLHRSTQGFMANMNISTMGGGIIVR